MNARIMFNPVRILNEKLTFFQTSQYIKTKVNFFSDHSDTVFNILRKGGVVFNYQLNFFRTLTEDIYYLEEGRAW